VSKKIKIIVIATLFSVFVIAGSLFFWQQNSGNLSGGDIALPKLYWLALVIFYWYVAPALLLLGDNVNATERLVLKIHSVNVWSRALIELCMMYITHNWHPYYGIAHDIFSVLMLVFLLSTYYKVMSSYLLYFMVMLVAVFLLETVFASYMVTQVQSSQGVVYFVPSTSEHSLILIATWFSVIGLLYYLIYFFRGWLYSDV